MATIEAASYSKIPIFADAGNVCVMRLRHSQAAAVTNGDTIKLGKLPAYAEPISLTLQISNLGSASLDVFIDSTEVASDLTAKGVYPIDGISPSESGERDISVKVDTADTGANFSLVLDIAYCVTQLGG